MSKGINILFAAAAGFIGGILLAPKSGAETRKDLKHKADDANRVASEKAGQIKGAVKDGIQTVRTGAKDAGEELSDFANSAKASASRVADEAKNLGYEAKNRAERVAENGRDTGSAVKQNTKNHLK